jgi:rubrerythrin
MKILKALAKLVETRVCRCCGYPLRDTQEECPRCGASNV